MHPRCGRIETLGEVCVCSYGVRRSASLRPAKQTCQANLPTRLDGRQAGTSRPPVGTARARWPRSERWAAWGSNPEPAD